MSRQVFYCKSWFRAKKRPTELWSEADARVAHEGGQAYVALVDSIERPFVFSRSRQKLWVLASWMNSFANPCRTTFKRLSQGCCF